MLPKKQGSPLCNLITKTLSMHHQTPKSSE